MSDIDLTPKTDGPKRRRWPVALLVAFITGCAGAALALPVSDWAMEAHHVSSFEGGRAYAAVCIWVPLGFVAGAVVGFAVAMLMKGAGFVGYVKRQIVALVAITAVVLASGGLGYATADHPPLIDDKNLALDIEVRLSASGRSIEQLKAADFSVALVSTSDDRSYSDARWSDAVASEEFITVRAWGRLNSRNAGREITAGVEGENRQIFSVTLRASPAHIDENWSEWAPARQRFDGSKPLPQEQYQVRYRVRFADEYSPTPAPTPAPQVGDDPQASPSATEAEAEASP